MKKFIIEGSHTIMGEIKISGNKNAVLPSIAASILTDEEIILENVPDILDVRNMLEIASFVGVEVSLLKNGVLSLRAREIRESSLKQDLCSKLRTSILFAGPILARCGKVSFWPPGGAFIGRRRLDAHFYGLKCLGAKILSEEPPYSLSALHLTGQELFFDEASVTATEHILMTATIAKGITTIRNAASEPHVRNLAEMLIKMGAKISGLNTNTLVIEGVEKLHGTTHTVAGDHIEAGSFLALAASTRGEIKIHGTNPGNHWMTRRVFEKFGAKFKLNSNDISFHGGQHLFIEKDLGNAIPVISDGPWPQYPTDLMSCTIVMATQSEGTVLFFEKMFESRMYFVDRLISMGANAIVCDPHRVVISGPSKLRGIEMSSPDIRAGMAMLIAALCAKGTSIIQNADIICRGYERIEEKILSIGGKIRSE